MLDHKIKSAEETEFPYRSRATKHSRALLFGFVTPADQSSRACPGIPSHARPFSVKESGQNYMTKASALALRVDIDPLPRIFDMLPMQPRSIGNSICATALDMFALQTRDTFISELMPTHHCLFLLNSVGVIPV